MMKRLPSLLLVLMLFAGSLSAQNTVGLLDYVPSQSYEGYNLVYPFGQSTAFLLNMCGEIVHQWEDDADFRPGASCILLENGNLVRAKRPNDVSNDPIWAGGGGATIDIVDWDNNPVWSYTMNNEDFRFHHDIAVTDDGTILAIAWESFSLQESVDAGRDTAKISEGEVWSEVIFEIDPETDEIIWEWHAWDHLVQDYDPDMANYGVIADNPRLIDLNYDFWEDGRADWLHFNSIDYDEILDQIIISVPTFGELWIIDHSTTTAEAATGSGGLGMHGGDLLYRWGNPQTYGAGTPDDQKLFFQHDLHWINDHLDFTYPDYGKIAVFNNRVGEDYSTANVITQPWDEYEWEYTWDSNDGWGPEDFSLTIMHPDITALNSDIVSGVQFMPNGNALICSGRPGYSFEVTPDNEVVWEYITPIDFGSPAAQYDTLAPNSNITFRMERYPTDFPAFDGQDLTPQGYIETNPDVDFCDQFFVSTEEVVENNTIRIAPNPASDQIMIEWEGEQNAQVEVYDLLGRPIYVNQASFGSDQINVSDWEPGFYFVRIDKSQLQKFLIQR